MSVFGAYVLKTWCVHLLQVHGVNMQSGELGIGGCVASNLGRASQAQASGVVLGAATSCCYVLLLSSTLCYFYYLALPVEGRSRVELLWESSASLSLPLAASVDK